MHLFFYKYFPRFTTGICRVTITKWDTPQYQLLTGNVRMTTSKHSVIAEVEYFNLFGYVLFPRILRILKH